MPLTLTGSLKAIEFRFPAELPLNLNEIEHFSKVSLCISKNVPKYDFAEISKCYLNAAQAVHTALFQYETKALVI